MQADMQNVGKSKLLNFGLYHSKSPGMTEEATLREIMCSYRRLFRIMLSDRNSRGDELFKMAMEGYEGTYARIGWSQGWFCASLVHPASRNIPQLANVKVAKLNGDLEELPIPNSIRSIVCLNLPSFSGGLNPWGMPNDKKSKQRGLTPPFVDDGLIEVVGFRDGWHGLALLAPNGHGTRLAQAHRVVFEFHQGAADHNTYMRMDGEPWKQPLPKNDDTVIVEISHLGQVSMLATENCISKSIRDQNAYPYEETNGDDETNDDSDADPEESESRRKFGAATTFKIDIDHID